MRLLVLGAHCDDIEIGAGGTLLEWLQPERPIIVDWVVLTSTPERAHEARSSANAFLAGAAWSCVTIHSFRDGYLPYEPAVKDSLEEIKGRINPDIVLTHSRHDRHQDHRTVSDLTWNTFRDHLVLEYEIPKYDGDLGQPNCFVPVSEANVARKWALLSEHYSSQAARPWFTADTFAGLARLRGIEARSPTGFAEAFDARKVALDMRLDGRPLPAVE